MIDEKGRLFGKINIVDLIVILVIVIAAVVVGMKFLGGSGSAINPTKTPVRYTVLVEGVGPEVYENIQKYIPGQLMASGEMLDGHVVAVEAVEGRTHTAAVDTADGTLEISQASVISSTGVPEASRETISTEAFSPMP